ncbi:sugar transferase [Sporosarcina limicola]|uniref:Lipopolysaccharide/colanic/teichoic acid biosynthesis glycosyltransferase n=1 Tax=Sporosarcina limicola TaxID=34101 RepID=A0A927R8K0_9BACL|nr:sugar transferase [Sporosarcina limicola]MBE1557084.1 lipopolysaccharide/colanic/teichoic acid biosynthesis glycosyltransferase [Sporosarcina limicola]
MEKVQYNIEVKKSKTSSYTIRKRVFDVCVGLLLLILLIPLLFIFSTVLLVFSGRPIFLKQIRTGQNNKPFTIWKFRTMESSGNQEAIHVYDWSEGVPDDFLFKTPSNQRITRIGKIYRKLSIDELPQLINVIRGEMSFVGPRPEIPEITLRYNRFQSKRLQAKPGITGFAQINGRSIITHGKKIEYDHYYIDKQTFMFDMEIIIKTIGLVIRGKGAC